MPVFETMEHLEDSILEAGLAPVLDDITRTARPVILFTRTEEPDDPLPHGTSKLGGHPDLPKGFAWPTRPAGPDAGRWASNERRRGARLRDMRGTSSKAELDALATQYEQRAECHLRAFPLAFQAQLNLAELSRQDGFDADLPDTGLLSIFADVTRHGGPGRCAFWHKAGSLVRTPPPAPLALWYDLIRGPLVFKPGETWETLTMAEVFTPHSAVCIPDHWFARPNTDPFNKRFETWRESMAEYSPKSPPGAPSANFGDRLGGWPHTLQGNPEDEVATASERVGAPGDTPWRHLFCWGGEYLGEDTRLVPWEALGDGNASVLIRQDDLDDRRFDKAVTVIQRT